MYLQASEHKIFQIKNESENTDIQWHQWPVVKNSVCIQGLVLPTSQQ